jgi:hypothetical protein
LKKIVLIFILLSAQITTLCAQELDTLQGIINIVDFSEEKSNEKEATFVQEYVYVIKPSVLNGEKTINKPIKLKFDPSKRECNKFCVNT